MDLSSKIKVGALWGAGARFLTNALGLVSTFILARLLVPSDFGVAAIGTTFLGILHSFTQFSLGEALIHHEDPDHNHLNTAWTLGVLRAVVMALILLVSAPFVASFYQDDRLIIVMTVISASALCAGLYNPRLAMLKRELMFWQDFVLNASQRMAMVVVSVSLALIFHSYIAIVGGIVALNVVGVTVSYIAAPYLPKFRLKEARELFSYSGWLTLSEIVSALNWRADPLIVGKFLGQSGLGVFTVASNLSALPTNEATAPIKATLFPGFRKVRDDAARLRRAYVRAQTLILALVTPCAFGMAVLADPLIRLVVGEKWLDAIPIVHVLAIIFALKTLGTTADPLAMATGHTRLLFRRNLQSLLIRLPIVLAGLYLGGLNGLLVALTVTTILGVVLDMMVVKQICGLTKTQQFLVNARTLFGGFAMAGLLTLFIAILPFGNDTASNMAKVVLSGAVGLALYLGVMFLCWAVAGRPDGPEREILAFAGTLRRRFPLFPSAR